MALITITSDYGTTDPYLPALKGALYREAEGHLVTDLSHHVEPGNYFRAAYILRNSYASYPKGTVHLIAFGEIAPNRKLLGAELDGYYFLVADNGLLSMINPDKRILKIVEIDLKSELSLFPSHDILAKSAGFLANGGKLEVLGRSITDIVQKTLPRPRVASDKSSILGTIMYIDNFGNLISNITRKQFRTIQQERPFTIMLPRNQRVRQLSNHYHEVAAGSVIALFNSQDLLEIAVSGASGKHFNGANCLLGVEEQNSITVEFG
jgi:S-adenosylmethionine hydrolase